LFRLRKSLGCRNVGRCAPIGEAGLGRIDEVTDMKSIAAKFVPKLFRRFAKSERGVTAIEFAIVIPPFLLIMFVMVESGFMLFTEYVLQTSVQKAARQIKTGQAQSAGLTAATFKTEVCKLAGIIIDCSKITVYARPENTFATLKSNLPSFMNVGASYGGAPANPTNYGCGAPLQAAGVIATYDWKFSVPFFMSPLGNIDNNNTRRLLGVAVFRNEPFPSNWTGC
jgi:Flp pilus assembly protein TadG